MEHHLELRVSYNRIVTYDLFDQNKSWSFDNVLDNKTNKQKKLFLLRKHLHKTIYAELPKIMNETHDLEITEKLDG